MRKAISIIIAVAILLMGFTGLAGCITTNNHVDGKYNLEVAVQNENGEIKMMELWKKAYEAANPNVNIIINNFGNDDITGYMQKKAMNQNALPHLVWLPDDFGHAFTDPDNGYFIDLRELYESDPKVDYSLYYESMLHAASNSGEFRPTTNYNGEYEGVKSDESKYGIYFAPRDYNRISIVYNKALFNNFKLFYGFDIKNYYDVDHPENWNMDKLALLVNDLTVAIKNAGVAYSSYKAIRMNMNWEAVYTTIFNELGSDGLINGQDFNLGSENNREIYDYLYDNFFNDVNKFDLEDNFTKGITFMTVVSRPLVTSYIPYMKNKTTGKVEMDFIPFPAENIAAGCSGYGITKKHADTEVTVNGVTKTYKEIAWDFIKFINSEEGQNIGGLEGFIQPILKSLEKTGEWRNAIDPTLNHDAWYAGNELRQTTYNAFSSVVRKNLRTQMSNFFYNITSVTNGAPEKRGELITKYIDNLTAVKNGAIL